MRSDRGMTLLEVLVALAVLALTGLLLSEGLRFGTRVWDRSQEGTAATIERFQAIATLRALVEQAEPPGPWGDEARFVGEEHGLALTSREPVRLTGGWPRRVVVYHRPQAGELRLRVAGPDGTGAADDFVLLRGVGSLKLRYMGFDPEARRNIWFNQWVDRVGAPQVVAIDAVFFDGRPPIGLRVSLRRDFAVECLLVGLSACQTEAQ
jgi:prepilin-type N-terminal cleavage/methylation domain-containing protein